MNDLSQKLAALSPEMRDLLLKKLAQEKVRDPRPNTIAKREKADSYPLSFAQQRLWFLDRYDPGNPMYNVPIGLRLNGPLDVPALQAVLQELVQRHETLRTTFHDQEGQPCQVIAEQGQAKLQVFDVSSLPEEMRETEAWKLAKHEAKQPFDLSRDSLLRSTLIRVAPDDHLLLLTMHHIISDRWSNQILKRELLMLYAAKTEGSEAALPPLDVQYADYAVWQQAEMSGPAFERLLAYWKQQLAGAPALLELPTDRPRPARQTFDGAVAETRLPASLSDAIRNLSLREDATVFMTLLTAFNVLLSRYSGQSEIVVGSPVAGRSREEIGQLLGFFVNTLAMRSDMSGQPSFREALQRVRETVLSAFDHQELPFERIVDELQVERDTSITPMFQVTFTLQQSEAQSDVKQGGLLVTPFAVTSDTAKFDLELFVTDHPDGFLLELQYNTGLFDGETAERMLTHLHMLLQAAVAVPEQSVEELLMMPEAEREQLLNTWNRTGASDSRPALIHRQFEEQAARIPDQTAFVFEGERISYGELNERANRVARALQARGVQQDVPVGLFLHRSLLLPVAMLGVLKAGGAYVPLDPSYPKQRLSDLIEDANLQVILTEQAVREDLSPHRADVLALDADWETTIAPYCADNPDGGQSADSLAYVIYTSGSTGKPKGVMIEHRNVTNFFLGMDRLFKSGRTEPDTMLAVTSMSFDISVLELLWTLTRGDRVVLLSERGGILQEDGADFALASFLQTEQVTMLQCTPSLMQILLNSRDSLHALQGLRAVLLGGETLPTKMADRLCAELPAEIFNMYGPTETTIWSTVARLEEGGKVTIGAPIANTAVYVLDEQMQPVPIGVKGELYIGGAGLARGYLHRPELTADRFVINPFAQAEGERLYRTGDSVRWLPDGQLEYLGRLDQQMKIRGHRIEQGEIEAVLAAHPGIREAAVTAVQQGENMHLAAYVVPDAVPDGTAGQFEQEALEEQIGQWQSVFDNLYVSEEAPEEVLFDTGIWKDSYTGDLIDESEMREWAERTVERIMARQPRRVLEIGCGSGLLLTAIAPHTEQYTATDFSQTVLHDLRRRIQAAGIPSEKVALLQTTADDFTALDGMEFDMVVINSVVQYFPNLPYLLQVLQQAAACVKPGGAVFLGDIRHFGLIKEFVSSVLLHQAQDGLGLAELSARVQHALGQEEELLIDPEFFARLPEEISSISHVQVELKRGHAHNEMSKYRYDVTLHIASGRPQVQESIPALNWRTEALTLAKLCERLAVLQPPALALLNVPNARVLADVRAARGLEDEEQNRTAGDLKKVASEHSGSGVDPEAFWALEADFPYSVHISWAGSGRKDAFDVYLLRREPGQAEADLPIVSAQRAGSAARKLSEYGNNPLHTKVERRIVAQLRRYLQGRLPEYMLPSSYQVLTALPLTPNGKLDRKALPQPNQSRLVSAEFSAPRNETEELVAAIWSQLLLVERVGIQDNFFELGGHSLLATQAVSRVSKALGIELPLRTLFEEPTVAGLVRKIEQSAPTDTPPLAVLPLVPVPRTKDLPLSFAQNRMWFLNRLQPDSPHYNMSTAWMIAGTLNAELLGNSLRELTARQEALRTVFPDQGGQPRQVILEHVDAGLQILDLSHMSQAERDAEVKRLSEASARETFDLAQGPLFRSVLLRLSADEHLLLLAIHHIISDGWSQGVFFKEWMGLYEAALNGVPAKLPELPVQYADYAVWQREWLQGPMLEQQLSYWKQQLDGAPARLELPTDRPRPAVQTYKGAIEELYLPRELKRKLHELCKQENVTLFMLLLSAFKVLLYRYSNQEDIVVGTPIANRSREDIENLIGFFVNTLVIRTQLDGDTPFRELLGVVREHSLSAYAHQDLPFERLVDELQLERDPSRNPLFQAAFALQNAPVAGRHTAGLTLSQVEVDNGTAKVDLAMFAAEEGDEVHAVLQYNTDLFEASTVRRMLDHYQALLESITADPKTGLGKLKFLSEAELHKLLVELNSTPFSPPTMTLPQLVEAQTAKTPDRVALIDGKKRLTYRELNERANRTAHWLQKNGIGPEILVGLCMERSQDLVITLLGILKAGGAYVPLDPNYPADRIVFTLEDAQVALVMTQEKLLDHLQHFEGEKVCLEQALPEIEQESSENPAQGAAMHNLAYVIYTSGSTGRPKGIEIEHRNASGVIEWSQTVYSKEELSGVMFCTSICFDISIYEMFAPLSVGGKVILAENALYFPQLPAKSEVTLINSVPSAVMELLRIKEIPSWVGVLNLAGEPLKRQMITSLYEGTEAKKIYNLYGPSEDTTYSTAMLMERGDTGKPLVGRPLPGTTYYVLNAQMEPVPQGVAGELYLGGAGLSRGYLNRPELTAERYLPNPFLGGDERIYRTGDLVRILPDGTIDVLGRIDHQVKIRGHRIETGEIEAVLQSHAAVEEALVMVRADEVKGNRLTAYVVPGQLAQESQDDLGAQATDEQVAMWQQVFDRTYEQAEMALEDPIFNIAGWNSSYSGEALPAEEMREWVDTTVARILALKPKRVLEIGCGSGLLLSRIAPHCDVYYGCDFSQAALYDLEQRLKLSRFDMSKIKLLHKTAEDFSGLEAESFDLVVINSVVQYFPSADYLLRVLSGAVNVLEPDGALFVGDVRSFGHNELFQSSVQLFQAMDELGRADLLSLSRQKTEAEKELVIAPEFFYAAQQALPALSRIEFQVKRGDSINELTKFRYDVVLHLGQGPAAVAELTWLDWQKDDLSLVSIGSTLEREQPKWLSLRRIPNARTAADFKGLHLLKHDESVSTAGELRRLQQNGAVDGLNPEALYRLADELGYHVQINWSLASGDEGCFDAVFRQEAPELEAFTVLPPDLKLERLHAVQAYTSNPVQAELTRLLVPRLREFLKERLPEYMVPSSFVVLEAFPTTPNGKVDRNALPDPDARMRLAVTTEYVAPKSEAEQKIAAVWAEVLGLERVGIDDNFFDLGGHSLLLVQVHSRLSPIFANPLSVVDLFRFPTVKSLALFLEQDGEGKSSQIQTSKHASERRNTMQELQNRRQNNRAANRRGGRNQ